MKRKLLFFNCLAGRNGTVPVDEPFALVSLLLEIYSARGPSEGSTERFRNEGGKMCANNGGACTRRSRFQDKNTRKRARPDKPALVSPRFSARSTRARALARGNAKWLSSRLGETKRRPSGEQGGRLRSAFGPLSLGRRPEERAFYF